LGLWYYNAFNVEDNNQNRLQQMIGALPYVTQGFGYGFLAGVTIGPFLGYVVNVILMQGWRRSLPLISIPVVVDTPIIIVMVFLLGALPEFVLDIMSILGGMFVLWLGWTTWQDNQRLEENARRKNKTLGSRHELADAMGLSMASIYLRGLLVNALNPAPYLFWSTVSGPILRDGIAAGGAGYAFAFLLTYYAVFLSLIFVLMQLVERTGELNERFNRYLMPVTIFLMVVLGLGLVGAGIADLVPTT
jgi:threonine/homoserine/homoserine lactone efflux protein